MSSYKKNPKLDVLFLPGEGRVSEDKTFEGPDYAKYEALGLLVVVEPKITEPVEELLLEPEPDPVSPPPPPEPPAELQNDNLPPETDKVVMNESVEPVSNLPLLTEPAPSGASGSEATEETDAGMITETLPPVPAPALTEASSSPKRGKKSSPWEKK